jgi:hypothetical protein
MGHRSTHPSGTVNIATTTVTKSLLLEDSKRQRREERERLSIEIIVQAARECIIPLAELLYPEERDHDRFGKYG